jgi:hypothetical protein
MLIPSQNGTASPIALNALVLEANAVHAGLALGCRYSSSDEYEAEVIRIRRAAGAYQNVQPRRQRLIGLSVAAVLAIIILVVI